MTEKAHFQPEFVSNDPMLSRISYRPDSQFVIVDNSGLKQITLLQQTTDARDGRPTTLMQTEFIHGNFFDDRMFAMQIRQLCIKLAVHEVDEWLKIDGTHVVDPHPKLTG